MKRISLIVLLAAGVLLLQQAVARQAKVKSFPPAPSAGKPAAAKLPEIGTTLGQSAQRSGNITKAEFDALVKQGIKLSSTGTIKGFNFTYAERMLYEDSAGNPLVTTDYLQEYCLGDTLSPGIQASLFDRTKPGDTAYFNQIKVILPSGAEARGTPMKFVIVPAGRR